jgi:hypothetical protein
MRCSALFPVQTDTGLLQRDVQGCARTVECAWASCCRDSVIVGTQQDVRVKAASGSGGQHLRVTVGCAGSAQTVACAHVPTAECAA